MIVIRSFTKSNRTTMQIRSLWPARDVECYRHPLALAERLAAAAEEGRVDLGDLGRRARRVLEQTARPTEAEQLF